MKADEMQRTIERLLGLSSNDLMDVNRKNKPAITSRLGVRPVIMSNELPYLPDSSGAMNSRLMVVKMRKSFIGREDTTLKRRVMAEIQGIFNWALDGLDDLEEYGKLIQPSSANNYIEGMAEGGSPLETFLKERCTIGEEEWAYGKELWHLLKGVYEDEGRHVFPFNRLLANIAPIVTALGGDVRSGQIKLDTGERPRVIKGISIKPQEDGPKEKK
jgi:putative DNA primase/helicase